MNYYCRHHMERSVGVEVGFRREKVSHAKPQIFMFYSTSSSGCRTVVPTSSKSSINCGVFSNNLSNTGCSLVRTIALVPLDP